MDATHTTAPTFAHARNNAPHHTAVHAAAAAITGAKTIAPAISPTHNTTVPIQGVTVSEFLSER